MSGYPTSGSVNIVLSAGKVSLKRIASGWEYLFGATGLVYSPPDCTADAAGADTSKTD